MNNLIGFQKRIITACCLIAIFLLPLDVQGAPTSENYQGRYITEVLKEIAEQYDVFFTYDAEILQNVQVHFKVIQGEKLEDALTRLLAETNLGYEPYGDKYMVIYQNTRKGKKSAKKLGRKIEQIRRMERDENLSVQRMTNKPGEIIHSVVKSIEEIPLEQNITGLVVDTEGTPLIGATVIGKNSTIGTSTDLDGKFSLTLPDDVQTLVFSYTGYQMQEVDINGRSYMEVIMSGSVSLLDEVVVIGYGTQRKSDLTGSVSSVKSEDINAFPNTNIMQALVGRAPGVEVIQSTGAPGGPVNIRIRGTNSIMGGNEPLYVVDGVPLSGQPTNLNSSDIQSIEILKDASATAIYGSRGANGVVLVTTKEGHSGETRVDFEMGYSVQKIRKKLDLLNASQYAQLHNDQAENDGLEAYFSQEEINAFGEGTDWQDLLFDNAPIFNTSISVDGGNKKTQFSVGGSMFLQDGIMEGSDYDRYSFRTRFDHEISDQIKFDLSLNLSRLETGRKDSGGGSRGTSLFNSAITSPPTAQSYNEDGSIFDFISLHPFVSPDQINPYYFVDEEIRSIGANVILGNASISYSPIPGLTFKTMGGIENRDDRTDVYQTLEFRNSSGSASVATSQFTSLLSENTISYQQSFGGRHDISAVTGFTYQDFLRTTLASGSNGFLSDIFETYNLGAGATPGVPSSGYSKSTLLSYLARINYSLDSKYLFTVSFRADGSSRFSDGNKWGYFPSAAVAWRISEETFLQDNNIFSNLKLRASWGLSGSQAISPYATLNQLQSGNTIFGDNLFTTFAPGTRLPSDLKWETTEQIDIGVEMGFIQNRLSLTADYYVKNTRDLLNTVGLPSSLGYTTTIQNIGSVQNRGIELGLDAFIITRPNLNWNIYASAAFNTNEVLELAGGKDILTNFVGILVLSDNIGILREGRPIGQFYGFLEDGYDENGFIKYQDLDGDGEISDMDKTYIGDPNPDIVFGLNSSLSFMNFDLTFFFQGTAGNDIFNVNAASVLDYGRGLNAPRDVLANQWTTSNTDAKYPVVSRNISAEVSDRFIEDGSYVRLRNIELAYSLPIDRWEESIFRQVQLYFSGQNLATFTSYSWWDPEVNSRGADQARGIDHYSYPISKSFTGGIRIGF